MGEVPQIEVASALVCDDVRKEIGGKETVVGIYIGDIIVATYPANLLLCLWLLVKFVGTGMLKMQFRALGADDNTLISFDGEVEIGLGGTTGTLSLPRLPLPIGKDTLLKFEWKLGDGEWQTIINKQVRLQTSPPGA